MIRRSALGIIFRNRIQLLSFAKKGFAAPESNRFLHHLSKDKLYFDNSNDTLCVDWGEGKGKGKLSLTWLRLQCQSVVHSSGQRVVFPGDLRPEQCQIKSICATEAGSDEMLVYWNDGHQSIYSLSKLYKINGPTPDELLLKRQEQSRPTALREADGIPMMNYKDIIASEQGLYQWLEHQVEKGLCIVQDCPKTENSVKELASLISPISHSYLYGEVFDVVSEANAVNIAYTNLRLRLHSDLPYYESVPGYQYLHCLRNDAGVAGGRSEFLDAFAAAQHLRDSDPEAFEVLCRVPATFQKVRGPDHTPNVARPGEGAGRPPAYYASHLVAQRPHIELDTYGEIVAVTWSPPFEGVLQVPFEDIKPYYAAYRRFQAIIESSAFASEHTLHHRLAPGELACFNNRRVLHARAAFEYRDPEARRHLQGTYLNSDEVLSRYLVLKQGQIERDGSDDGTSIKFTARVGNKTIPML